MSKKILFATIPMLPPEALRSVSYRKENTGEVFSLSASFPSIPMIEWNVDEKDDVKLYIIMTDDDNGRTKKNFEKFKEELEALKKEAGLDNIEINGIITLPHEETKKKQVGLFQEISKFYEENADIYMDITYGTKITSIGLFSSLIFAEKLKNCNIKSIIYGKFAHNDSNVGDIYDVRCLYDISRLVNAADYMPAKDVEALIGSLWA